MKAGDIINILQNFNKNSEVNIRVNNKNETFYILTEGLDPITINFVVVTDSTASYVTDCITENISLTSNDTPVIIDNTTPVQHNPRAAHVGPNVSQGKGNWFSGTTWG